MIKDKLDFFYPYREDDRGLPPSTGWVGKLPFNETNPEDRVWDGIYRQRLYYRLYERQDVRTEKEGRILSGIVNAMAEALFVPADFEPSIMEKLSRKGKYSRSKFSDVFTLGPWLGPKGFPCR